MSIPQPTPPRHRRDKSLAVVALRLGAAIAVVLSLAVLRPAASDFAPVTDGMLQHPDPADWINWRRTSEAWGYSPLEQINRANVGTLQLAWAWPMQTGASQTTPLVYGGVMYIPSPSGVQAVDAATGDLVWEFKHSGVARRNLAIYGTSLFATTRDAHLLALDARTGKLRWDRAVADAKLGFSYTSGPIIVKGQVIAGIAGCELYKEEVCFISAHDPESGAEKWRTNTIARPGEAGGDSWGGIPARQRAGGDAWMPGSFDPTLNLIYWGTSQPKPWAQVLRGTDAPALFTSSTLAIDADTGKLAWHYQHLPAETHDLDEAFERILVDVDGRPSVFSMGKVGVLWQLDRQTGAFIKAIDPGYQTVIDVDRKTGRVTYRPGMVPALGAPVYSCPGQGGFKNLYAMGYHPATHALYVPMMLTCGEQLFTAGPPDIPQQVGKGALKRTPKPFVPSPDTLGELLALDVTTGKVLWRQRETMPVDTAPLTTAGGLVFAGDMDRHFSAYDAASGALLWRTRTAMIPDGSPITYAVRGRQYLAVPTGPGFGIGHTHARALKPEARLVQGGGSAMMVFALPETRK